MRRLRPLVCVLALAVIGTAATGRYTIRNGDTLSELAARHGTTTAALAQANGIADPDRIVAGRTLVIPGAGEITVTQGVHTVQPGETLGGIAHRYGTSVAALARANGVTDPDRIVAGVRLALTDRTAPAPASIRSVDSLPSHIVQPGDTIAGIAARYGTTPAAVAAANGIVNGARIYAGTRLLLAPAVEGGSSPGAANGPCPVESPSFFNDWGFPRSGGRFHEGNDVFARAGTPVRAPVSGVVEQDEGSIGGLQFRLRGDDGHVYIGSHLARFGAAGRVDTGDVIGYVGTTGNAKGGRPQLHFEIHPSGETPVNPYPTLVSACRS